MNGNGRSKGRPKGKDYGVVKSLRRTEGDAELLRSHAPDWGCCAGPAVRRLGQSDPLWRAAQAIAEVSPLGSRERGPLDAVMSWGRDRGAATPAPPVGPSLQVLLPLE